MHLTPFHSQQLSLAYQLPDRSSSHNATTHVEMILLHLTRMGYACAPSQPRRRAISTSTRPRHQPERPSLPASCLSLFLSCRIHHSSFRNQWSVFDGCEDVIRTNRVTQAGYDLGEQLTARLTFGFASRDGPGGVIGFINSSLARTG